MGKSPENNRHELESALEAVTTSFAVGRPVSPVSKAPVPVPPVPADRKQELASAYDKLVEHEATRPRRFIPPLPPVWKRFFKPAIIVVSLTVAVYLSVARPAWLYPRFEAPADPGTTAGAEQILTATSLLVDQFQRESGHLPANLSAIEGSFPSVSMMPTGTGGYRLISVVGTRSVVMTIRPGQDAILEGGSR